MELSHVKQEVESQVKHPAGHGTQETSFLKNADSQLKLSLLQFKEFKGQVTQEVPDNVYPILQAEHLLLASHKEHPLAQGTHTTSFKKKPSLQFEVLFVHQVEFNGQLMQDPSFKV